MTHKSGIDDKILIHIYQKHTKITSSNRNVQKATSFIKHLLFYSI